MKIGAGRVLLAAGFAGAVWLAPGPVANAQQTACGCVHHASTARQSGRSLCSAAESETRCAVRQTMFAAGADDAEVLRRVRAGPTLGDRLRRAGIDVEPAAALRRAATEPPEAWDADVRAATVATVLALTQPDDPVALIPIVRALQADDAALMRRFADPGLKVVTAEAAGYRVQVGYGCVELARGRDIALARTPFAHAVSRCGDLP